MGISRKCMDIETVGLFCDCIAGEEAVDKEAQVFCDRAKNNKDVTDKDLAELKMALKDREHDACCDCRG